MKRLVCILLFLCSASMACNGEDPVDGGLGDFRSVAPRLSGAERRKCCARPRIETKCEAVRNRREALRLLVVAGGDCLDKAIAAARKYSPDDLAAAYLIRGERNGDPVDFLRALETAKGFNRALALEKLFLKKEAIAAWNEVIRSEDGGWKEEAQQRLNALLAPAAVEWRPSEFTAALERYDRAALARIVREFPSTTERYALQGFVEDPKALQLLADVLAERGEPYLRALDKDRNLFSLQTQYANASERFNNGEESLSLLDPIAPIATDAGYHDLAARIETLRANALEYEDSYFEAYDAYERALKASRSATSTVEVWSRRSQNYATVGSPDYAFRDAWRALQLLPRAANRRATHQTYAAAATATRNLGYPQVALLYQIAAVDYWRQQEAATRDAKNELAVALRARADVNVELGRVQAARTDLTEASDLAKSIDKPLIRAQVNMRLQEILGEIALINDPAAAEAHFTDAIALATKTQDSTYRAALHFKRAAARRKARNPAAGDDIATALNILGDEAAGLVEKARRGRYEALWNPYFSRFQSMYHDMIESRIAAGDLKGAFVYAEQARAFEPMQLLLQSHAVPPGFEKIDSIDALNRQLPRIPADTVILQFLVLPARTYAWVLTRGKIELRSLSVPSQKIDEWVTELVQAIAGGQSPTDRVLRAAYTELFAGPLHTADAAAKARIVIVPDGPLYGIPFAALRSEKEGYLIERAVLATAGSTSLYFYALARDQQLANVRRPSVLAVGNPDFDRRSGLPLIPLSAVEARDVAAYYEGSRTLIGAEATIPRFLQYARGANVIHFAGHGVSNPDSPWLSRLLLTPQNNDSGLLTAEKLMKEVRLDRTRLVVLGACSSANGQSVGPQGLAPLVRPLIAANVPGVVGTLWNVNDATAQNLLVSLHCHYRNGDDVAVALRKAQLEALRKNISARHWAPYQVVGYAGSPYAPSIAREETESERVCSEDSLHRPDGLHSQ